MLPMIWDRRLRGPYSICALPEPALLRVSRLPLTKQSRCDLHNKNVSIAEAYTAWPILFFNGTETRSSATFTTGNCSHSHSRQAVLSQDWKSTRLNSSHV